MIREVRSKDDIRSFLDLPDIINKDQSHWIRPLDKDVEAIFDPQKNKAFRHGECARWIMSDDSGKIVGRVAAFVNRKTVNKGNEQPTGGMGFFDCINDRTVAFALFDHCKQWLQQRGMEAMDGPVNFGDRDSWWGLIVEGFHSPQYKMNYNPPYYKELFESYGFHTYFEQWCYSLTVADRLHEKFYRRHGELKKNPDYHAEFLKKKFLLKYADDFCTVYNKAWAKHGEGKALERKQVQ